MELHKRANSEDMKTILIRRRWRWIQDMCEGNLSTTSLEYTTGHQKEKKPFNLRTHGGGRWKRNEKKKLTWGELEKVTQDRD